MSNVSCFWRDPEFQDATLLLSSDTLLLEQTRAALHETLNGATDQCDCVWACMHNPKKRKINPTVDTAVSTAAAVNPSQLALQASTSTSNAAPLMEISATPAVSCQILTIPVHRIILSSESAYFKTAISTLIGDRASAAAASDAAASANAAALAKRFLSPFHPIIVVHEQNIDAAEGVLQFLYTKTVDSKFNTASQLMHLLLIADRWVVPGCVTACCKALSAMPAESLTLEDVLAIYSPVDGTIPPSLLNAAEFKPVLGAALSKLLQLFGNVPTIVSSPTLTAQLLRLPHAALLALLSSDALLTDCEDNVLMLLSWWVHQNDDEAEDWSVVCEGAALLELMGAVRYSRLSSTYMAQAWLILPRLKPSDAQLRELQHFRSLNAYYAKEHVKEGLGVCPKGWLQACRPLPQGSLRSTASVTLAISAAQLGEHLATVQAMKEGGPAPNELNAATDLRGLSITLAFKSDTCGKEVAGERDFLAAYVGLCMRLPRCSSTARLDYGVPGAYTISIQSNGPGKPAHSEGKSCLAHGQGWWNFAQSASKLPGDPSVMSWWDPYLVDGHVRLTAEFTDKRIC